MSAPNMLSFFNIGIKASLALVGVGIVASSLYTVEAGKRGLIFDRFQGVKPKIIPEGTHFLIPYLQNPIFFNVRISPGTFNSSTASKDMQRIQLSLRVLFRPDESRLKEIYTTYGIDYDEAVLPSIANEVAKAVIAQFNAEELVTQRDNVSRLVRNGLVERATHFGIILEDVSIIHIGFSPEFTKAIEHKQVAQQTAEKQKFLVERAKQEKFAEVILAEGETEAARMIQEAMKTGNEFIELRRIEAAKEIAETLSKSRRVTYLSPGTNILLNANSPQA